MSDIQVNNVKGVYDSSVLSVMNLVGDIYVMRMANSEIATKAKPGQFVNIKVNNEYIPLLRKPFSICRRDQKQGWFEVLWKIVGKGTKIMAGYKRGDTVNLMGPLGRGYLIPPEIETAFLVGGGLGVAPLPFLCEEFLNEGKSIEVFLGAKSEADLSLIDVFEELGVTVHITTEDGSVGKRGMVTSLLIERLQEMHADEKLCLFSCGPDGFLRSMIDISEKFAIKGQMSIETMMGCGFGICVGCPVRVRNPKAGEKLYKLTCIDGPVFDTREVVLDG